MSNHGLSLKVLEGYPDTPQDAVHMDNASMALLGVSPQEFIEIIGKRKTLATCLSLYLSDKEKKGIIRVDGIVRNNADIAIGDTITVRRIEKNKAEKVLVTPLGDVPAINMQQVHYYQIKPLLKGDNFSVSSGGAIGLNFKVIDFSPESYAGVVTLKTIFVSTRQEDNLKTSNELVTAGIQSIQEEDNDKALECFEKAIKFHPENVEAWNWKSDLYLTRNQLDNALNCCDKVLGIDPRNTDALRVKGIISYRHEKLDDSISYYDRALEIDPVDIDTLIGKGLALAHHGNLDDAMFCFQESLKIGTDNAHSLFGIALVKSFEGKSEEAFKVLQEAILLDPSIKNLANREKLYKNMPLDKKFGMLMADEIFWKPAQNPENMGLVPSFYTEHYKIQEKPKTFGKLKDRISGHKSENSNIFFVLEAYARDAGRKTIRIDPKELTNYKVGGFVEVIRTPIFDWNQVPGNDSPWLTRFLKNHLMIDWVENSTMTKINDGNTILITSGEKNITIELDKIASKATMLIYNDAYFKYTFSLQESTSLYVYPDKFKTIVRCMPIYPSDEGKGIVRIENLTRYNTSVGIGEFIFISKNVESKQAEKIVVSPLQKIPPIDERYLADAFNGEPVIKGDWISVPFFGGSLLFEVLEITPSDAVTVTEKTIFQIAE